MWKQRKAKDFMDTEEVEGHARDSISRETIKELLDRLGTAEGWLLKHLLGDNYAVKAAAINVKVVARKGDASPETYVGDLYVVQNTKTEGVWFKLYSPRENRFIWAAEASNLNGYVDLKCNTHILHLRDALYTFKFPDKKERCLFGDNLNKFLYFEKTKR